MCIYNKKTGTDTKSYQRDCGTNDIADSFAIMTPSSAVKGNYQLGDTTYLTAFNCPNREGAGPAFAMDQQLVGPDPTT